MHRRRCAGRSWSERTAAQPEAVPAAEPRHEPRRPIALTELVRLEGADTPAGCTARVRRCDNRQKNRPNPGRGKADAERRTDVDQS